jgi:tetratricopeptide (TPR) repeat protein
MHITLMESERENLTRGGTKNVEALLAYYRGQSHFYGGKVIEESRLAISAFHSAVMHDPGYAQAWSQLAISHAKMVWYGFDPGDNHGAEAKRAIETALRLDPESPDARLASGYYYYWVERDSDRALEEFALIENSGIKSSELYDVYAAIAYVQRRRGEFEKTIAYLQIALTQDPDANVKDAAGKFAERAWEIGNTYMRLRRWVEAERYLLEAIRLAPEKADPYIFLSRIQLYGHGRADSAISILMNVPASVDSEGLAEERVTVNIARRDPTTARSFLTIANDDTAYYNLQNAWIAELEKDEETARLAYDSAAVDLARQVVTNPRVVALRRYLAIAYAGSGRREEALREGKKALELQPPDQEPFFWGPGNLEGMARIHAMLGEQDEAVVLLDSLLRLPAGLITPAYLKIAPEYDPLRGNPRFELLLSQGQPTASAAQPQRVWAVRN